MKKVGKILMMFLLTATAVYGQHDAKAKEILDKLSTKNKAFKNIKATFVFESDNKAAEIQESQEGTILVEGNKYKIKIEDVEVISDGETKWTVQYDVKEVMVESLEDAEEEELAPSELFTIYESGFKYRFINEEEVDGKMMQVIDLVPEDPKAKSYSKARIYVDKDANQIYKFQMFGKNGTDYTYIIKSFESNITTAESDFKFDESKCEDCEILE